MDPTRKHCPKCATTKPIGEFYANRARADGLSPYCVECQRAVTKTGERALRMEVVAHLGGCCVRCGFTDSRALQIDHVNGGGRSERRVAPSPRAFYRKVLADSTGYALLCANCNWIKKAENEEWGKSRTRQRPTERKPFRPRKRAGLATWTRKHECCVECGTTERKHASGGLCCNCYQRQRARTP